MKHSVENWIKSVKAVTQSELGLIDIEVRCVGFWIPFGLPKTINTTLITLKDVK